jgi:GNAT superfamily N-acetyltransferase
MTDAATATLSVRSVTGAAILPYLDAAARLRIEVFRAFPYLYAGSLDNEQQYLRAYAAASSSVCVLALHGAAVVGVATGMALADADPAFQRPFSDAGEPLDGLFYHGESVLRAAFRGRGLGHAFFAERERHARALGMRHATFCAVVRAADHPQRPPDYRPLDPFWRRRGYAPLPGKVCTLAWQTLPAGSEQSHQLQFWGRDLGA